MFVSRCKFPRLKRFVPNQKFQARRSAYHDVRRHRASPCNHKHRDAARAAAARRFAAGWRRGEAALRLRVHRHRPMAREPRLDMEAAHAVRGDGQGRWECRPREPFLPALHC
eukprot:scaffold83166_cov60-Phaeocystis_antarctica.AAC.2